MANRQDYIYQLAGKIVNKKEKKKKDGSSFCQLTVVIPEKEQVKKINIFSDSCKDKEIWQEIEENKHLGKKYVFHCKNYMGSYYLVNWEELANYGSN